MFGMCVTGRMDIRKFDQQIAYDNDISSQKNDNFGINTDQSNQQVFCRCNKDVRKQTVGYAE